MSKAWSSSSSRTRASRESSLGLRRRGLLLRLPLSSLLYLHSEDRVRKGADRLKARLKTKQQGRLDSFFTVKPKDPKDIKKRKVGA